MRKYFYDVTFSYIDLCGDAHYFHIGYFSCLENANHAIDSVKHQPGFDTSGGSFETTKIAVTFKENNVEKRGCTLYELSHEFLDDEGYDNFTIFGLFSTYDEALQCQRREEEKAPYRSFPDGFVLSEVKVDVIGWQEGFSSW